MLPIRVGMTGIDVAAQRNVLNAFQSLTETSLKLSTLKRINRGSDDPAGMIAALDLHRELTGIEEALAASERTRALVHVADSGLASANNLLNDIQANVLAGAGNTLSSEERQALQLEIDAALDALDRIGTTTTFHGKRPLSGESLEVLMGPNPQNVETLDLPEVNTGSLGGTEGILNDLRSGGSASLDAGDPQRASSILDAARTEILSARVEMGAFERYSIDATQHLMSDMSHHLSAARSQIEDTDMARGTADLVRSMILTDSTVQAARLTLHGRRAVAGLLDEVFRA